MLLIVNFREIHVAVTLGGKVQNMFSKHCHRLHPFVKWIQASYLENMPKQFQKYEFKFPWQQNCSLPFHHSSAHHVNKTFLWLWEIIDHRCIVMAVHIHLGLVSILPQKKNLERIKLLHAFKETFGCVSSSFVHKGIC